jgi:hypothetical protein
MNFNRAVSSSVYRSYRCVACPPVPSQKGCLRQLRGSYTYIDPETAITIPSRHRRPCRRPSKRATCSRAYSRATRACSAGASLAPRNQCLDQPCSGAEAAPPAPNNYPKLIQNSPGPYARSAGNGLTRSHQLGQQLGREKLARPPRLPHPVRITKCAPFTKPLYLAARLSGAKTHNHSKTEIK